MVSNPPLELFMIGKGDSEVIYEKKFVFKFVMSSLIG